MCDSGWPSGAPFPGRPPDAACRAAADCRLDKLGVRIPACRGRTRRSPHPGSVRLGHPVRALGCSGPAFLSSTRAGAVSWSSPPAPRHESAKCPGNESRRSTRSAGSGPYAVRPPSAPGGLVDKGTKGKMARRCTCQKPHLCWSRRVSAAVGPPVNRDRRGMSGSNNRHCWSKGHGLRVALPSWFDGRVASLPDDSTSCLCPSSTPTAGRLKGVNIPIRLLSWAFPVDDEALGVAGCGTR